MSTSRLDDFMSDLIEASPTFAAVYARAQHALKNATEQPCRIGCCVEYIDPDSGDLLGGFGPAGCECGMDD